ncbi:MAG: hypothetical protein JNM90_23875 [Burkholderiales bacterium]|nr:hypothetical protein [Burkholderiales bacterium]
MTPDERDRAEPAERRWVWMDRWDPATWPMPENPSPLTRALAAVALVIVLVMVVYLPLKILGVF